MDVTETAGGGAVWVCALHVARQDEREQILPRLIGTAFVAFPLEHVLEVSKGVQGRVRGDEDEGAKLESDRERVGEERALGLDALAGALGDGRGG